MILRVFLFMTTNCYIVFDKYVTQKSKISISNIFYFYDEAKSLLKHQKWLLGVYGIRDLKFSPMSVTHLSIVTSNLELKF